MRILIASDFRGEDARYEWLTQVGPFFDAVALPGHHLRFWKRHAQSRMVEDCVRRIENQGVPVWIGESGNESHDWPWLRKRLIHRFSAHAVAYCQPTHLPQAARRIACVAGNTFAEAWRIPFLVVGHKPPPPTPASWEARYSGHEHAAYYQPDYFICGEFDDGLTRGQRSKANWFWKLGRTWILNSGCRASVIHPAHIILDTTLRKAYFYSFARDESDAVNITVDEKP